MTARAERMDLEVRINFMICCADVFFSRWCSECGQWFDPEDLVSEWCWEPSSEYSSWSNLLKSAIFSAWKSVSEFRTDLPTHSVGTWSANENDILRSPRINHCAFISPLLALRFLRYFANVFIIFCFLGSTRTHGHGVRTKMTFCAHRKFHHCAFVSPILVLRFVSF